jgi:hypothetical protein
MLCSPLDKPNKPICFSLGLLSVALTPIVIPVKDPSLSFLPAPT